MGRLPIQPDEERFNVLCLLNEPSNSSGIVPGRQTAEMM
jgi:hypothetical protein